MKLPVLTYQCDNCGLCCTKMLARAFVADAIREPRIAQECHRARVDGLVQDWYLMNKYEGGEELPPCRFHTGKACGIYQTRPNVCVTFQAGSPDCQNLRQAHGIAPLEPVTVEVEEDRYVNFDHAPKFESHGAVDGSLTRG